MNAWGRLVSMKEESLETIAKSDSSFLSAYKAPKCIHNSIVHSEPFVICFIT